MENLPPVEAPLVEGEPNQGQGGAVEPGPVNQQPDPWYTKYGFQDEAAAVKSFDHARRKISEQGRELGELKRAQVQPVSAPAQPIGEPVNITFDQFVERPGEALAKSAEMGARKALSEYMQAQELERMLDEACNREGLERWEVEEAYNSFKTDPRKTLEVVAAVAKMRRAGVQTDEIRQVVRDSAENKARAVQTTSTQKAVEEAEPNWEGMDFPQMMAELARRGMVAPPTRD